MAQRTIIIRTWVAVVFSILLVCLIVFFCNLMNNRHVRLTKYRFASEDLPKEFDGFKVMVISDYHNSRFYDQIGEYMKQTEPDLILLTGDLTELPDNKINNLEKLIERVPENTQVMAVSGNHESESTRYDYIVHTLREWNVQVLENEATDIWRGDQHIKIIGLKDPGNATRKIGESKIEEMKWFVNGCLYDDADCFSILACHRANLYPFFKDLNTNLMLSGHLHGGIVRLPGLGGMVGENMELHPDYTYGEYDEGHTKMIVSRGCDYNLLKMRVFNGPEVLLVTLRSER